MRTLVSNQDDSVNFVIDAPDGGKYEARFVRRCDEYFIVYLSSHSGCNKACRMCHLTATRQTMFREATAADFLGQAYEVMAHYDGLDGPSAQRVNYNWMARGEPLANRRLQADWASLRSMLTLAATWRKLESHFNISTIMPAGEGAEDGLSWLQGEGVTIYYSIYSTAPSFRKRWLPKAMPVVDALDTLADWQIMTGGDVVLHGPFIHGQNDDPRDIENIVYAVQDSGLRVKRFNQVVYNPPNDRSREASPEAVEACLAKYGEYGIATRQVPRVGFDVQASCGMFVNE